METYELPKPADWIGTWRVTYVPNGATGVSVNASTNSAMSGKLEEHPVTDYRAALFIEHRGKDYTFHWQFTRSEGPNQWVADEYNSRPRKRFSPKYDDYAAPTYAAKIERAVTDALETEFQRYPDRWSRAARDYRERTVDRLEKDVAAAKQALGKATEALEAFQREA